MKPITPALAAEYVAEPGEPTRPASLATLTIAPPPRSCIAGSTAWVHGQHALQVHAEHEVPELRVGVDEEREAVGPGVVDEHVDRPDLRGAARSPRGRRRRRSRPSRPPSPSISPATSRAPSRLRSATATRAPSAASRRAVAAPMPLPPPVTSAVRPSSRMRRNLYSAAADRPRHDHRRHRRPRLRPRGALGARRHAGDHRLARRRAAPRRRPSACARPCPDATFEGLENAEAAAAAATVVVMSVPFAGQAENLRRSPRASAGHAPRRRDRAARRRRRRQGDAHARRLAGLGGAAGGRDGAGRRATSSPRCTPSAPPSLADLDHELDEDVLVCGDRKDDKQRRVAELIARIPGLRRVDAGRLEMARIDGVADRAADLDERPLQDARRHPHHRRSD